jgi:hypothetical protein
MTGPIAFPPALPCTGIAAHCIDAVATRHGRQSMLQALRRNPPLFFIDGQPFWGNDRMQRADEQRRPGGW